MSYIPNDRFHMLVIKLKTNLQDISSLYLNVYQEGSSTPISPQYVATRIDDETVKFTVPNRDLTIGATYDKFEVELRNTNFYTLGEGVNILVDGKEYRVARSPSFTITFGDTKTHKVQAVYKGNREIGSAYSNTLSIRANRRVVSEDDPTPIEDITGDYNITIVAPSTMKYMEKPDWTFILRKGTKRVPNRVLEVVVPDGMVYTKITNNRGEVYEGSSMSVDYTEDRISRWKVGKYKIGAYMQHFEDGSPQGTVVSKYQDLEIVKVDPTLTVTKPQAINQSMVVTLTNPWGSGMKNHKINYTINKQTRSKNTDNNGRIAIPFTQRGTFTYEITSASDSNFNQAKVVGSVTIS